MKLLAQADEWQELLEAGRVPNRAALAKRVGVSAWRVGSILALLKLHPTILEAIRALPLGTPERLVTERKLRPLTRLSQAGQLRQAAPLLRELRKQSTLAAS